LNSGIYKIINKINNKFYIGSAVNLTARKQTHFYRLRNNIHENSYLQNSFNKYGEENFYFEVIEIIEDKNKLLIKEQYWIDTLNPCNRNKGYNICTRAGSRIGTKLSEKHKEILRKPKTEQHKKKISESHKGFKYSEETKIILSNMRKGRKLSNETKNKISKAHKDKILSEEHRNNLSKSSKGRKLSAETKSKISKIHKGGQQHTKYVMISIVKCRKFTQSYYILI